MPIYLAFIKTAISNASDYCLLYLKNERINKLKIQLEGNYLFIFNGSNEPPWIFVHEDCLVFIRK